MQFIDRILERGREDRVERRKSITGERMIPWCMPDIFNNDPIISEPIPQTSQNIIYSSYKVTDVS